MKAHVSGSAAHQSTAQTQKSVFQPPAVTRPASEGGEVTAGRLLTMGTKPVAMRRPENRGKSPESQRSGLILQRQAVQGPAEQRERLPQPGMTGILQRRDNEPMQRQGKQPVLSTPNINGEVCQLSAEQSMTGGKVGKAWWDTKSSKAYYGIGTSPEMTELTSDSYGSCIGIAYYVPYTEKDSETQKAIGMLVHFWSGGVKESWKGNFYSDLQAVCQAWAQAIQTIENQGGTLGTVKMTYWQGTNPGVPQSQYRADYIKSHFASPHFAGSGHSTWTLNLSTGVVSGSGSGGSQGSSKIKFGESPF